MDTNYLRELAEEGAQIHTETQPERKVCDGLLWALDELAALRKDAERYRYLRNRSPSDVLQTTGDAAGCWIDCEAGEVLTLLTGEDADAAIDAAMAKP